MSGDPTLTGKDVRFLTVHDFRELMNRLMTFHRAAFMENGTIGNEAIREPGGHVRGHRRVGRPERAGHGHG